MEKRLLVLSFSKAVIGILSGTLTPENLSNALFYFGCVEEHARYPWKADSDGRVKNELERYVESVEMRPVVHQILINAIDKARDEGRIIWRKQNKDNTFNDLNKLLKKNGYPKVNFEKYDQSYYNRGIAKKGIADNGLPFEVIG